MNRIIGLFLALVTAVGGLFSFYVPPAGADFGTDYGKEERDMEKYCGIYSCVGDCGGVPTLYVNGEPFPAAAYMTYLEQYNNYSQFADAGYSLFSVPVLFAGRWINANDFCTPFHGGIFDKKGEPDFSSLDNSVGKILEACPGAYIFPRVNVSMPLWWIEENPGCTDGTGKRESLFAPEFRSTAADMLKVVIDHINKSDYASHIVGYQLAGGNTEEWFHFDLNAGLCKNAEKAFNAYLEEYYPGCGFSGLSDLSLLQGKGPYHKNPHLAAYLEFASNAVADDICYLSSVARKATGGNVVIGTFYGYSLEVTSSLYGTHALNTVLECDSIDFICSPNSYIGTRDLGVDWTEMYPADSVRLHNKICMQECDIRTHLTKLLSECAPEYDTDKKMTAEIWHPLKSKEQSFAAIRKSFSRQLIKGNGFWWFDMWGGWYNDPDILAEMSSMRQICAASLKDKSRAGRAETAVFVDESAYKYYTDCALKNAAFNHRKPLGYLGAPYDIYDVKDFEAVYKNYKAVIFLSELKTANMSAALEICKKDKVSYISVSAIKKELSVNELRAYCKSRGVHIYCESNDIIYVNDNYIAICSASAGDKTIRLPAACTYTELLGGSLRGTGDTITLTMKENETRLFRTDKQ